jgi:DNA-damage-inducible protein D
MANQLTPFEGKNIRSVEQDGETWFSLIDIIEVLSDSPTPRKYWDKIKRKLKEEGATELSPIWRQLKLTATDGKERATDCSNTEGVLRIIQSVPSPKAEPFKQWLAGLGTRELIENADPERLTERQAELYRAKGYSEEWIERRLESIKTRIRLTDEWKKRGVEDSKDYGILTATIAKQTFGLTPSEHSKVKGLQKENLRDHMTPLELIFSALGEEVTRQLSIKEDAQGFDENRDMAIQGGSFAGNARERLEKEKGLKVVSTANFLEQNKSELPENAPADPPQ